MIQKNIDENQNNSRLDHAATYLFKDYSRSQIQRWISQGNLLVNGEIFKAKDKVHTGDEISLDPVLENRVSWDGEDIPLDIFHEEEDFLIINKSPGLIMHPGAGCNNGTLANALAFHFPYLKKLPRCGIVHRLDKDTSGLLVIAKNEKFRNFFVDILQNRKVYKQYEALVVGHVIGSFYDPDGEINEGHFVLVRNGEFESSDFFETVAGSRIFVVTVWSDALGFDKDKELALSATLRDMREKGQITVDQLIKMNPLYKQGQIWTHGDLINILAEMKGILNFLVRLKILFILQG